MWLHLVVHLALINMLLHRSHTKLCVLNDSANPKINNFSFRIISIIKFTLIFEIVLVTSDHKHLRIVISRFGIRRPSQILDRGCKSILGIVPLSVQVTLIVDFFARLWRKVKGLRLLHGGHMFVVSISATLG